MEMIEFCMKNFTTNDPYILNKAIKFANETAPEKTVNKDFFELLFLFNQECNTVSMEHLASNTLIVSYLLGQEFIDKKEYKHIPSLIAKLWEFCCAEGIELSAKRYFSSSELLHPCK